MKKNIVKNMLYGQWVHSHEEDTETERVYRPASFAFPRSRGRSAMALKPDGGLVETGTGPADRPRESRGSWKLENDDMLFVYEIGKARPKRQIKIVSLDRDKLVVKK